MKARSQPSRRARPVLAASALALGLVLTGCGSLGQQADPGAQAGEQKGYVGGDGTFTEIPPAERGDPVTITGKATEGPDVDSGALLGTVVVLNLWYAGCGPCQAEAPDLVAIAAEHPDVRFLGINTLDSASTARAFERKHAITWPSVLDAGSKSAVLALHGATSPQAVPTTLVIDRQGRVAARVLGQADPGVLDPMITRVVGEGDG